jgi:four helix bundle protein
VWQDAIDLYVLSWRVFRKFPYELRRVASQAISSADSIHRNIAEGYCRRSLREYLQFLNFSLGSLGESVSGFVASRQAEQITEEEYNTLNDLSFKLENGLLKLVESPHILTQARAIRCDFAGFFFGLVHRQVRTQTCPLFRLGSREDHI